MTDSNAFGPPAGDEAAALRLVIDAAVKHSLDDALHRVGRSLPPNEEQILAGRIAQEVVIAFENAASTASYRGPMPPPAMLEEFERVVPGLARQIAAMALEEQKHRHRWERRALWNDMFMQSGGIFLGWTIALICAVSAAFLAWAGNNVGAGILLSVVAVSLVRTFVGLAGTAPQDDVRQRPGAAPVPPANDPER